MLVEAYFVELIATCAEESAHSFWEGLGIDSLMFAVLPNRNLYT